MNNFLCIGDNSFLFTGKMATMTRDEGWRADLAFLAREIKRRAYAPFREISEREFDAATAMMLGNVWLAG